MAQTMKELQKIKGIGTVFAKRFLDAGYDTFGKIAAAGEEGLRNIRGINAQMMQSVLAQAGELAREAGKTRTETVTQLKRQVSGLTSQVQEIALNMQKRFQKEVTGKKGKKVKKEMARIIASLERAEGQLQTEVKKTGKVLVKAEKKLGGLTVTGLKELEKGLKKTRKSLQKNLPK